MRNSSREKKSPRISQKNSLKVPLKKMSVFQINIILYLQIIVLFSNYNIFPRNRSILILTCEKNWKASQWKKKCVCESEKHGKKWTWNDFCARKETSKRGQKLDSRAVLLFKGEVTGCILISSLHLKFNFPNRQNKKCSKVKRIIQKKNARKFQKKIMGNKKNMNFEP